MDAGDRWVLLPFLLGTLIVSSCVHEAAHAWAAWRSGDHDPELARRSTPFTPRHVSLWFTLVIPAILILTLGWAVGGARPVRFRPDIGDGRTALVAFAGPMGNVLVGLLVLVVVALLVHLRVLVPSLAYDRYYVFSLFAAGFSFFLGAVNLIPLPPLDGSKIAALALPKRWRAFYHSTLALPGAIVLAIAFIALVTLYEDAFAAAGQDVLVALHRAAGTITEWIAS